MRDPVMFFIGILLALLSGISFLWLLEKIREHSDGYTLMIVFSLFFCTAFVALIFLTY
jgi:hypothetical protein